MISPYQVLQESGFSQYTAMVRFTYDRENTSLGAEKLAEMVRAIPGSTRVTTVSLDKENGIAIFSVKLISAKTPKAAFCSFKENALKKFKGMLLKVEIGAGTIEKKGDFILMKEEKRSNLSTCISQLIEEGLLLEVSIEELNKQYVESGKLPKSVFDHIVSACNNQSNYATWLCKRIADGICSEDAIDTWGERFEFFNQYKQRFQTKDINQLKTREQIENWVQNELNPVARDVFKKGISGGSQVNDNMIEKLEKCRVSDFKSKITDREYYVFRLGRDDFDVEEYLGSGTSWCTRDNKGTFINYINYRDSAGTSGDYWIFVNKSNPQEKWQLLFKANYFCNRKDKNFLRERSAVPVEMLKFLKDKYGQQFDYRVQDNIDWLEQSILNAEDDSTDDENFNLEHYLIGTESSYKAYQLPFRRDNTVGKILTKLGLAKNPRVAEALLGELDVPPMAVILNVGSKKAEPLYVGSARRYLVQADNGSLRFESIKNENEYKLLKHIEQNASSGLLDQVNVAWDPNLPGLNEFRYEGRNDVWKFSPADRERLAKASLQLSNLAASVATNGVRHDAETLLPDALRDGPSTDIYAIHVGHFVGIVLPPGVAYNRCVDTDIVLYSYGEPRNILPGFKAKMDRVGIPVHFEDVDNESDTGRRSNLFVACYAQNFTTLESLDPFKVTSSLPDANEKWDIYLFPGLPSRALFGAPYRLVGLRYKGEGNNKIVTFQGRAGYTDIRTLSNNGNWESEPARNATVTFNTLGVRTRGSAALEEIELLDQTLQRFEVNLHRNRRYARYLPSPSQTQGRRRGFGVPSYLREHWDELQHIEEDWSRRGRVVTDHGIKLPWDQAQEILQSSSPDTAGLIERTSQELNLLDVLIYNNSDVMSDWSCIVRFTNTDNKVVKVISRSGRGQGIVWRSIDINERNQITVDENGNRVDTAPPARQPRQPRAVAAPANGEAPQQAPADFNTEGLQQFQVTTQNATDAYRASGENAQRLLEVAGFTNFAQSVELYREQGVQIHTVIYRICPHRGAHATWAAILFADGRGTTVGSIPNNPTLQVAAAHSSNWRQLTHELDNSIASFQQLYDICEELHIPQTVAIQRWPNNRANRQ